MRYFLQILNFPLFRTVKKTDLEVTNQPIFAPNVPNEAKYVRVCTYISVHGAITMFKSLFYKKIFCFLTVDPVHTYSKTFYQVRYKIERAACMYRIKKITNWA